MQSMNTDQQQYYVTPTGSYQAAGGYHLQNGMDPQYSTRHQNTYQHPPHMTSGYYNTQMPNNYGPQGIYYPPPYLSPAPFAQGPRVANPSLIPVVRPPNETSPGGQAFIPQSGYTLYPNNNLQQGSNPYNQQQFYPYPATLYTQQNLPSQTSSSQLSNQPQVSQSQYSVANNNQPASQPSHIPQQSSFDPQHTLASQSAQSQDKKRERKPMLIIDPASHKAVELDIPPMVNGSSTSTTTATNDNRPKEPVTDSIVSDTTSTDDAKTVQKRVAFRQQFAELLHSKAPTDKSGNQPSVDDQTDSSSTKTKQTENVVSSSRTKSPTPVAPLNKASEQPQPGPPGIRTRSMTEDKAIQDGKEERSDSQQKSETVEIKPKPTSADIVTPINDDDTSSLDGTSESQAKPSLSNTASVERVTPPETPTPSNGSVSESPSIEKTPSISKRLSYTKEELLNRRSDPLARKRPTGLKAIEGVTEAPIPRQMSMGHDSTSRRPQNISIDKPPPFRNQSDNPYKPVDPNKVNVNDKFLREVTAILNKVTPQTYEKLLLKLDELELDRYERLDGMISIIFSKAVDEKSFCSLYASLCKHFQKKQVTVPSEDGETVTHYFRQILLTRCQKEFQNDYRQDIGYEKRKQEVEAITDEKVQREESEKLEEDLAKAKRKKLGNIFFIGELFKLQMLTAPIMYDCVEYLLGDKTDEESLECLCRLLRTIGKELDIKAGEKTPNRATLEKNYAEMVNITKLPQTSSRIRFMIQDLIEQRKADWVARRVEAQPTTIDAIHEAERLKREQQERDQERDRLQRRDQHRGGHPQQYAQSHGSRGSGVKQQSNRTDEDRNENRFSVNQVRQLHSNDKRNQGSVQSLSFAPPRAWNKGSGVEKKAEDDRSNTGRTGKPPAGPVQQLRPKTNSSPGTPGYPIQRQSSRELARETSQRDRENAMDSLRKTTNNAWTTNSREGSRNVSREASRNASPDSSVNERVSNANSRAEDKRTTANDTDQSKTTFNEEKTQARVHSLIDEYTENYSDDNERPVKEAIEDLTDFCTSKTDEQAIVVRELFTNVLEAKARAHKAVGHLLGVALHNNILSNEGFSAGFQLIVEAAPDYAVDIPLIWQYIGEVTGAFIGACSSSVSLLKPILQSIPAEKSKQFFQYVIRYAVEFSSKSRIQRFWQSSGFSLNDLLQSDSLDSSFTNEYTWLSEVTEAEITPPVKENLGPRPDSQLVKLFKAVNDQGVVVSDNEIVEYIRKNMNPTDKYYIRNIVLSYLEACLINRGAQKKIQEDIAKTRMTILNTIIDHKSEAEVQAVYAIQNFVHKLEHPQKMARLLFDIFYDEECVNEDSFFEWRGHPDQSENEGHSVVEISTKDFFTWLQQAESEGEEEES